MKEFEAEFRVRNNRLKERRLALGLSAPQLAKAIGVPYVTYVALESLRELPITAAGEWRKSALRLSRYFGEPPEELFPPAILAVKNPKAIRRLDFADIRPMLVAAEEERLALPAPDEVMGVAERQTAVALALQTLSPREEMVLRARFGFDNEDGEGESAQSIADKIGVTRGRVAQIESRALYGLRRSNQSKPLAECLGVDPVEEDP